MHVPDHLITDPVEAVAAASAVAVIAGCLLRRHPDRLRPAREDPGPPMALWREPHRAGPQLATAALVFGLQMVNFPVLSGTSGHLLGGALATALIGPRRALLAVSAVVITQALFFADGGAAALGVNLWLIAIVPVALAAAIAALAHRRRERSATAGGVASAGVAAALAAPASASVFTLLVAVGGTDDVAMAEVAGSMVGVHLAIGLGEALLTVVILTVVVGANRVLGHRTGEVEEAPVWVLALVAASALSIFASSLPDGLERVAADLDLATSGPGSILSGSPLGGYAAFGATGAWSGSVAGVLGVLLATLVAGGLLGAARMLGADLGGVSRRRDGARTPAGQMCPSSLAE